MPLYEYICEADGEVIELLRPIAQADAPVEDPKGLGRAFVRMHSTFASRTSGAPARELSLGQSHACRCGKGGGCGH